MTEKRILANHDEATNFAGYFRDMIAEEASIQKLDGIKVNWDHGSSDGHPVVRMVVVIPYAPD